MKKLTAAMLCLCLLLCGCDYPTVTEMHTVQTVTGENVIIETPDTMYLGETVYAVVTCPVIATATEDSGQVIFTQAYQKFRFYLDNNQAQANIEADLQQRMNRFFADAAVIQSQAQEDYSDNEDWTPYYAKVSYVPSRVDGAAISLYALHESYNGAAPTQTLSAVNYDAASGRTLYLADVLTPECTGTAFAAVVLKGLKASTGLYHGYEDLVADIFSAGLAGYSGWYFHSGGLEILFSPYEISPGAVQVTLPYSSLEGLLREEFVPADSTAQGALAADIWQEDDSERFSFTAHAELDKDGTDVVFYPSETVRNLRIETGSLSADGAVYIPTATVFRADAFYLGNALIITTKLSNDAPILRISYFSGGRAMSAYALYNSLDGSILLSYG